MELFVVRMTLPMLVTKKVTNITEIEPRTAQTDTLISYLCYLTCCIVGLVCPCLIVIAVRTDYLQRLIFCQIVLNNNELDGKLTVTDNIMCDFNTQTIGGFDDWYQPKLGN